MGEAPLRHRRQRGFTLIEILAVLIIIGVVTAAAVISIRALGGRDDQGQAATRLAGLIELASENARMENRQYGIVINSSHYQFVRFGTDGWIPVENDPVLKRRDLPDGMTMTVSVQNPIKMPTTSTAGSAASAAAAASANANAGMDATQDGSQDKLQPQIAILSTGEMTPFTLRLSTPDHKTYVLRGDGNGQVHIEPPNAASATTPED